MLAIDIGSKKVCVVEGFCRGSGVTVTDWGEREYKTEAVVNGELRDPSTVSFLIHEITETHKMKSKKAVISVNSSEIISRDFKLPQVKLAELTVIVGSEMGRVVGSDSGYVTDFVIQDVTEDGYYSVMAYALPRSMVEGYYMLLRELRLTPVALDVHANAIEKLLTGAAVNGIPQGEGNTIIADIGYSRIVFHGFTGGVCRFSRTEISPVQEFVREMESISRSEMTLDRMQQLDLSPDYEHESTLTADTCRYFISRLSDEIQRYSQYLMINSSEKSVGQVYLCGGVASVKGLSTALSHALKIAAEPLSSVSRVSLPKGCSLSKVCNAVGALIRK